MAPPYSKIQGISQNRAKFTMKKLVSIGRKIARSLVKAIASVVLIFIMAVAATSISPIYNFEKARPFEGAEIYNPYKSLDTTTLWKRANFHTHTRVEGIMNECDYWPDEVLKRYEALGYDIVTFSNHNEQTTHPKGEKYQSNGYEHGYNLLKFHKLAFGADDVWHFDHILPLLASQKQFQIEQLAKDADLVQINHPLRTPTLYKKQLKYLSGYKLIELDSGKSTENLYWDSALSAGRYCFGVANDDLHHPDKSYKIARRCNLLCTPSARYEDLLNAISEGCFYSMRIPDYGNGNWDIKCEKNSTLPYIKDIGVEGGTIRIVLSEPAQRIEITGQERKLLAECNDCDRIAYQMQECDTYARATIYFAGGEVIYTNPFARYDASVQATPYRELSPEVNILLTIMFNLLLVAICLTSGYLLYKVIKR